MAVFILILKMAKLYTIAMATLLMKAKNFF
jgi:hypothetical protein